MFKHYVVLSTGMVTMALGLAVIVSFLTIAYAADAEPRRYQELSAVTFEAQSSSVVLEGLSSIFEKPIVLPVPLPASLPVQNSGPAAPSIDSVVVTGRMNNVNLTFYDCLSQGFCGNMANGQKVYQGAAACSWNLALGTMFTIVGDPTGRVYTCADRGLLTNTWVDIFWYNPADGWKWQASVGRYGTLNIVSVPSR